MYLLRGQTPGFQEEKPALPALCSPTVRNTHCLKLTVCVVFCGGTRSSQRQTVGLQLPEETRWNVKRTDAGRFQHPEPRENWSLSVLRIGIYTSTVSRALCEFHLRFLRSKSSQFTDAARAVKCASAGAVLRSWCLMGTAPLWGR